jgi:hypothetical protein
LRVGGLVEVAHRRRAQQGEFAIGRELVPELLEPQRTVGVAATPEEIDHLAVHPHYLRIAAVLNPEADRIPDCGLEPARVGAVAVMNAASVARASSMVSRPPRIMRLTSNPSPASRSANAARCAGGAMAMTG